MIVGNGGSCCCETGVNCGGNCCETGVNGGGAEPVKLEDIMVVVVVVNGDLIFFVKFKS